MSQTPMGTKGFVAWVDDEHVVQWAEGEVCNSTPRDPFGPRLGGTIDVRIDGDTTLSVPAERLCSRVTDAIDALTKDLAAGMKTKLVGLAGGVFAALSDISADLAAAELARLGIGANGVRDHVGSVIERWAERIHSRQSNLLTAAIADLDRAVNARFATIDQKITRMASVIVELDERLPKPKTKGKAKPRIRKTTKRYKVGAKR